MPRHIKPLSERFWPRVKVTDDCWLWTGRLYSNGYGQIGAGMRGGANLLTHRVSYEMAYGPIPPGTLVLHHCDVRACVRPSHLFLGSYKDNAQDCKSKGRNSPPPIHTGRRGSGSKLSEEQVRQMRAAHAAGVMNETRLADFYGVSQPAVSLIVHRRTYRNVT